MKVSIFQSMPPTAECVRLFVGINPASIRGYRAVKKTSDYLLKAFCFTIVVALVVVLLPCLWLYLISALHGTPNRTLPLKIRFVSIFCVVLRECSILSSINLLNDTGWASWILQIPLAMKSTFFTRSGQWWLQLSCIAQ